MEACRKRRAKLVISGVGKSGIVARKIAATFSSFGLTAVFLNPVDALHGDLALSIRKTLPCCYPTAAKPTSCWRSFPTSSAAAPPAWPWWAA